MEWLFPPVSPSLSSGLHCDAGEASRSCIGLSAVPAYTVVGELHWCNGPTPGWYPGPALEPLVVSTLVSGPPHVAQDDPIEGLSREVVKYGSSPGQQGRDRNRRYRRRHRVRGLVDLVEKVQGECSFGRVATCGMSRSTLVEIKERDGVCYPSNVISCGSIWACPVCSAKIRARREVELEAGAAEWVARGGRLAMLTFTLRHDRLMDLLDVLNALLGSYRKLRHRKSFERLRSLVVGQVRALEVTYGENGWHPHLHVLLFVRSGVEEEQVRELLGAIVTDWRDLVGQSLGAFPSVQRAVDLLWFGSDSSTAAGYVSKIAKEMTLSDSKSGLDPFALLDVVDVGRDRAVARFIEFANTMRGRHAMDWSPGLRELLGLGDFKSDEEIASEDDDGGDGIVCVFFARQWNRYVKDGTSQNYLSDIERQVRAVRRE